jgi:hypothetical protein
MHRSRQGWRKHSLCSVHPGLHPPSKLVHSPKRGDARWLINLPHFQVAPIVIAKNRQPNDGQRNPCKIQELSKARNARLTNHQSTRTQNRQARATLTRPKHCLWHAGPPCTWTHMSASQNTIWKVRKRITTSNDGRNATQSKRTESEPSNEPNPFRERNHREKPGRLAPFRREISIYLCNDRKDPHSLSPKLAF